MNPPIHTGITSLVPWPTSDPRTTTPAASTPPSTGHAAGDVQKPSTPDAFGSGPSIPARRGGDGAAHPHRAVPTLHEPVSAADAAGPRDGALEPRGTTDLARVRGAWADRARATVRLHPLACVAAALALGGVLGRTTR